MISSENVVSCAMFFFYDFLGVRFRGWSGDGFDAVRILNIVFDMHEQHEFCKIRIFHIFHVIFEFEGQLHRHSTASSNTSSVPRKRLPTPKCFISAKRLLIA